MEEVNCAIVNEDLVKTITHGCSIIIVVNLGEDLLHKAKFKIEMKRRIKQLNDLDADILDRAYAEGQILLYPYLGNG